ncbi:MAG: biopolymer transporter ExbD [Nostocaceae cyanobacterium]|nr:biopolymer transporter ExbD [Nostocaceae cyanobacterium]
MRLPDEPDTPFQINIVPMIDVIFAILTFFIMSTLFLTKQEGLPVNLPQAVTGQQEAASEQIIVTLDAKGELFLNKQPITLNALAQKVGNIIGIDKEALVIINADESVSHGRVVAVMDRLRQVPGARLAIATQRP